MWREKVNEHKCYVFIRLCFLTCAHISLRKIESGLSSKYGTLTSCNAGLLVSMIEYIQLVWFQWGGSGITLVLLTSNERAINWTHTLRLLYKPDHFTIRKGFHSRPTRLPCIFDWIMKFLKPAACLLFLKTWNQKLSSLSKKKECHHH